VVDAAERTRLDRLVRLRGMTEEDARARLAAQATREQRLAVADLVVPNDGDRAELTTRVADVWRELCRRRRDTGPDQDQRAPERDHDGT
jgi:dephospho-CoA kinase